MMRRGTLADHDVASVLRQAAAERLSGQIDIDGDRAAVLYLAQGELSLACWADEEVPIGVDDDSDDATYSAAILTEERRLRAATRDVLGLVLERKEGWYHHHPLGEHRAAALWGWPVEEVLAEVAVRNPRPAPPVGSGSWLETESRAELDLEPAPTGPRPFDVGPLPEDETGDELDAPARPRDGAPPGSAPAPLLSARAPADDLAVTRPPLPAIPEVARPPERVEPTPEAAPPGGGWRLSATPPVEPLDDAAWAVVVALAGAATEAELVTRLGWPEVKADIVLRSLESRGVIEPDQAEAPTPEVAR